MIPPGTPLPAITFHSLDGKGLCRVAIQPSPRPVFIKEGQFEHRQLDAAADDEGSHRLLPEPLEIRVNDSERREQWSRSHSNASTILTRNWSSV